MTSDSNLIMAFLSAAIGVAILVLLTDPHYFAAKFRVLKKDHWDPFFDPKDGDDE